MSLFRGTFRPPAILSDEAVERYLAAIREELAPDPMFRRRLRGEVVNRYVAVREGTADAPRRRSMGRLGRAVLYASFTLALSTTSVLAASQAALPGDVLYPLKRQVESLRREVLPAHLHHDLAAYDLAERIDELARLTEQGDVAQASAMVAEVAADYEAFLEEADASGAVTEDRYYIVLTALLDRLPETAENAVQAVIDRSPSHASGSEPGSAPSGSGASGSGNGSGGNASGGTGTGGPGASNGNTTGSVAPQPEPPEATPKPTKSPKPEPMPRESTEPLPASSTSPDAGAERSDGAGDRGGAEGQGDQ